LPLGVLLAGCSVGLVVAPTPYVVPTILGSVHGGQQPVSGATITLWAVGTTGDGSTAANLTSTITNGSGGFTLGTYTCPAGDPDVYITATGGNPGLAKGTNNAAILMMAALTDCNTLKANAATTFVFVDEVTTVGSVAALYPYLTSTSNLSYGSGDAAAFATAFSNVSEYTNTTTGTAPGPNLPSGYYASSTEINTLGNIIATCINSTGGGAGDGTPCGNLFNLTRSGGVAPTTTLGAMLDILNNPTQNLSALFSLSQPIVPFQPVDSVAPSSWALPILPMAATPGFSVLGGTYSSAQSVMLSDGTSGAAIHYSVDGSTPTSASPIYNGTAITVSSSETINAIAQAGGYATSAVGTESYTINGSMSCQISGSVSGSWSAYVPVAISGPTVTSATTDGNGNYATPTNLICGQYTITPALAGYNFSPSSINVNVAASSTSQNFVTSSQLGAFSISGTLSYPGAKTGNTLINVFNSTTGNPAGGATLSAAPSAGGTGYMVRGLSPGIYTVVAEIDLFGTGNQNNSDPGGMYAGTVTISSSNVTGVNITLADRTPAAPLAPPTKFAVVASSGAAGITYHKTFEGYGFPGDEVATSYKIYYGTDTNASNLAPISTPAGNNPGFYFLSGLANGTAYYFKMSSVNASGESATTSVSGPVTIGTTTGNSTVSGTISFPGITPTGPLYVLIEGSGGGYFERIASPSNPAAYSISGVPNGNYFVFAFLDMNDDGVEDDGDIGAILGGDATINDSLAVSGSTSGNNIVFTAYTAGSSVSTNHTLFGSTNSYGITLYGGGGTKNPISMTLFSGPNVAVPFDMIFGHTGNAYNPVFNSSVSPSVGDTYQFLAHFSDGSTGVVSCAVIAVLSSFAQSLSMNTPVAGSATVPELNWAAPASPPPGLYSYTVGLANATGNQETWNYHGYYSGLGGPLPGTATSLVFDADGSASPNASLTVGATYDWWVTVEDVNGNTAQYETTYLVP
jgi:uncharacterized protein (DUF2141 family)